jgi:hypothetical protein
MSLGVADLALVSPLGLSPSQHVFFLRAEVTPHTSGTFVDREGALPIHDCPWIPALRPWASRVRLLARHALARVRPTSPKVPILLIAPDAALRAGADLVRFLSLGGHVVLSARSGAAAFVLALQDAREILRQEPEVIVLAVDSMLSQGDVVAWWNLRYSAFTRNPLPPCEGAAALRLVRDTHAPLAGRVLALASATSDATDENDLPTDGAALTRVFADLDLSAQMPLCVGQQDVDLLRTRDFHLAGARHYAKLGQSEQLSLEGRMGWLGSAAGLMSAALALAWLRHGLPLPEPVGRRTALCWARSADGLVGGAVVEGMAS